MAGGKVIVDDNASDLEIRVFVTADDAIFVSGYELIAVSVADAIAQCAERGVALPFEARSLFDLTADAAAPLVICCEVLKHVPETESALGILKSLAAPYLLVSVPREPIWRILSVARGECLKNLGNTAGGTFSTGRRRRLSECSKVPSRSSRRAPATHARGRFAMHYFTPPPG